MKRKLVYMACAGILAVTSIVRAQNVTPTATPARKPIVVKYRTMEGINFYYSGLKIGDNKELAKIIQPLNDPEINRLLKLSNDDVGSGTALLIAGTPVLVGGIVWSAVSYNGGNNIDTGGEIAGGAVAVVGAVLDYVGLFKFLEFHTARFAAVQRYNAIIHGDDLEPLSLQKPGLQTDLLAFDF